MNRYPAKRLAGTGRQHRMPKSTLNTDAVQPTSLTFTSLNVATSAVPHDPNGVLSAHSSNMFCAISLRFKTHTHRQSKRDNAVGFPSQGYNNWDHAEHPMSLAV